jgi:hypothetical protein
MESKLALERRRISESTSTGVSWASSMRRTGPEEVGLHVRPPAVPERLEASVAVCRRELHVEHFAELAVEVADLGLGTCDHADHHVADGLQTLGEDPQGHGLPGSGIAGDKGKAALVHEGFDPPGEALDLLRDEERLLGKVRHEGVPLEPVEVEELLGIHAWASFPPSLGMYAGGMPVEAYWARSFLRSGAMPSEGATAVGASERIEGSSTRRFPSAFSVLSWG